ncbi:hypothetical protein QBC41DRAFT_286181 [Cercophora samala]|uniref:Uncharacterized protein n=1 Tax=Cercophora samala TaxID=330535 RepID=A0AA40D2Q3_9PEZI|nr:hypothetical protein QBC41DRAFT_286181 [Cercophora samala]
MSRYRRRYDTSYRPPPLSPESSDDDEDYDITDADEMPGVVYTGPALEARGVFASLWGNRKPQKQQPTHLPFGRHREPPPEISSDDSDEPLYRYHTADGRPSYPGHFGPLRDPGPEIPSSSESDESLPWSPVVDARQIYTSEPVLWRVRSWLLWAFNTIIHAIQSSWDLFLRVFGAIGFWALIPLSFALLVYALSKGTKFGVSHTGHGWKGFVRPIPYIDAGTKYWPREHHTPSILDYLLGDRAKSEKANTVNHLWAVEHLQGQFADTAGACKHILEESKDAVASHGSLTELSHVIANSGWENAPVASNTLNVLVKQMRSITKSMLIDFHKRMRLFFTRTKDENLKLIGLAKQIKPKDSEVTGKLEFDQLGRDRMNHLVFSNILNTQAWIDSARTDLNILMRTLDQIVPGLEEVCAYVFKKDHGRFYHDSDRLVAWNKLLAKAQASGLSEKSAEELKVLPKRIFRAQGWVNDVFQTLSNVNEELGKVRDDLGTMADQLPKWTIEQFLDLYTDMAQRLDGSLDSLGPFVL